MKKRRVAILVMTVLAAAASIATDDAPPDRWERDAEASSWYGEMVASGDRAVFDVHISRGALPPELTADGVIETEICAYSFTPEPIDIEFEVEVGDVVRATGSTGSSTGPEEACFDPVGVVCVLDADCDFHVDVVVTLDRPAEVHVDLRLQQRGPKDGPLAPAEASVRVEWVEWR